jgi:hypothetical protein
LELEPNSLSFSFLKREEGRVRESGRKRRDREVSERRKEKGNEKRKTSKPLILQIS